MRQALREMEKANRELKRANPNLLSFQQRALFNSQIPQKFFPKEIDDIKIKKNLIRREKRIAYTRPFKVSDEQTLLRRETIRVGIPKALNIWATAPFWRSYFIHLGLKSSNVVFSDSTDERMAKDGIKYGSIDPCYPAKVAQAHIHNLLYKKNTEKRPLDYIFFPSITHVPSYLENIMAETACPVVQGTPNVMKAAFTREIDFFEKFGVDYIDGATTLVEPNYLHKQLFEMFGEKLNLTEDENRFAIKQAFDSLQNFDQELENRGKKIIEEATKNDKLAVLVLARPYHVDPGLSHLIGEEIQALGFPVLTMRSIPKDPLWLKSFFHQDLEDKRIQGPLDITDVWPENFSTNSAQKVWAAKFAARHPNIAVVDLSSFKCGHDAPTYGIIESIINHSDTAYLALHDLDQVKPTGSLKIRVKTFAYNLNKRIEVMKQKRKNKNHITEQKEAHDSTNNTLAG